MISSCRTIGVRARDSEPAFPLPLDPAAGLPCFGQPLESRLRSELSKKVVDDVAESAAIFSSALRRMSLVVL